MPTMPRVASAWTLTSERGVRPTWNGKLVVTVKETRKTGHATFEGRQWSDTEIRWRDAKMTDYLTTGETSFSSRFA